MTTTLRVEAAGAAHRAGLLGLFDRNTRGCFCRFWHFEGDDRAWLARCAGAPEQSREEAAAALAGEQGRGLVALAGDQIVGWLKLCRASALPKLYERRVYRTLGCFGGDRSKVFVASCLLVEPAHRHAGVATRLVEAAPGFVAAWGGEAIEAVPRRAREPVRDEELWLGPAPVFVRCGFEAVHDVDPYPVFRLRVLPA